MKQIKCLINKVKARISGRIWDGHCWDTHDMGVVCIDCGKIERIQG